MKAKPILFSGDMVRAILDGRKTQTRRTIKPQPMFVSSIYQPFSDGEWWGAAHNSGIRWQGKCPYGAAGDLLWVRETFIIESTHEYHGEHIMPDDGRPIKTILGDCDCSEFFNIPHYRATEPEPHIVPYDLEYANDDRTRWRPSIFMPRWASRLTLEIIDIRVERLQDISEEDAIAEGISYTEDYDGYHVEDCKYFHGHDPRVSFLALWRDINGCQSRAPWVWVVEFTPHLLNIDDYINNKHQKQHDGNKN